MAIGADGVSRRYLAWTIGLSCAAFCAAQSDSQASTLPLTRIAALDWGLAATLLGLRLPPVAVPAIDFYDRNVVDPVMPAGVVDVGLLFTPNFELLQELSPDLILTTPGLLPLKGTLERTAPVMVLDINPARGGQYRQAQTETRRLAAKLGREAEAERLIAEATRQLDHARETLSAYDQHPLCLINMLDGRHIRIFGENTLYQDVLDQTGLRNAWRQPSTYIPVGIEALADLPDARIVIISSVGDMTTPAALSANPFWNALPSVRSGRVHRMQSVLASGGVSSAARFAQLLCSTLMSQEDMRG
jgi:iron complex transport system substrate-binding protein